jgi:hypothetical protein
MVNEVIMQTIQNFSERVVDFFRYLFFVFIGYFSPIHDMVHVVLFFFFVDVIYGWRAAKKVNNARFQPALVWKKTMPRVLLSLVLLMLAYILDNETGQTWVNTSAIIGWAISGLLFLSILKNGYIVTNWRPFDLLGKTARHKIKHETGITIKDSDV